MSALCCLCVALAAATRECLTDAVLSQPASLLCFDMSGCSCDQIDPSGRCVRVWQLQGLRCACCLRVLLLQPCHGMLVTPDTRACVVSCRKSRCRLCSCRCICWRACRPTVFCRSRFCAHVLLFTAHIPCRAPNSVVCISLLVGVCCVGCPTFRPLCRIDGLVARLQCLHVC